LLCVSGNGCSHVTHKSFSDVLEQMIEEAISIIRNKGFEQQTGTHLDKVLKQIQSKLKVFTTCVQEKQPTVPWLKSQFWVTIKKIAANKFVDYDEVASHLAIHPRAINTSSTISFCLRLSTVMKGLSNR